MVSQSQCKDKGGVSGAVISHSCRVRGGVRGVISHSCRVRGGVSGVVISHSSRVRDGVSAAWSNNLEL